MNYLKGKQVYLSGAIEFASGENWRTEPVRIMREKYELNVFDPYADTKQQWVPELNEARKNYDYEKIRKIAKNFVKKDLHFVDTSTFLIAKLDYGVPSVGIHHEIINANNLKKPVLLLCEQHKIKLPIWYYGFIPLDCMFSSWDEIWEYLDGVNEGKQMNNDKWAITYGLI